MKDEREAHEPGPEIFLSPQWVFKVGARDSTLILKALGGRLITAEQKEQAKELGDRLTQQRAAVVSDFQRGFIRAVDAIERERT